MLRNDLAEFELNEDILQRRERLARERVTFDWYQPDDREQLVEFMERHFRGGWHVRLREATEPPSTPKILLPKARNNYL